jgi:hypothetical protein
LECDSVASRRFPAPGEERCSLQAKSFWESPPPYVLTVCRSGALVMSPEKDIRTGDWKYRIEGSTVERRDVAVVFCLKPGAAVFITVFERTS